MKKKINPLSWCNLSSGASSDFDSATKIAKLMVTRFGMCEKVCYLIRLQWLIAQVWTFPYSILCPSSISFNSKCVRKTRKQLLQGGKWKPFGWWIVKSGDNLVDHCSGSQTSTLTCSSSHSSHQYETWNWLTFCFFLMLPLVIIVRAQTENAFKV